MTMKINVKDNLEGRKKFKDKVGYASKTWHLCTLSHGINAPKSINDQLREEVVIDG